MKRDEEESRFMADTGMVVVRTDGGKMFLGLSVKADPDAKPDVTIQLTPRQIRALFVELECFYEAPCFDT